MSNANDMAFPVAPEHAPNNSMQFGLTKREYIAAMAMQGLLSNPGGPIQVNASCGWSLTNCTREDVAGAACRFADALLAELSESSVG